MADEVYLTRDQAAEWFQQRGLTVMTRERLEKLAIAREGPPFFTLSRRVYYAESALKAWLDQHAATAKPGRPA